MMTTYTPQERIDRYRTVLMLRKNGFTYEKIGFFLGVSRERARQLHDKAERVARGCSENGTDDQDRP